MLIVSKATHRDTLSGVSSCTLYGGPAIRRQPIESVAREPREGEGQVIHVSELAPEAKQVLTYLVLNHTLPDSVYAAHIQNATGLSGLALADALNELRDYGLIVGEPLRTGEFSAVKPTAHAWDVAGEAVVGFDVQADAQKVAQTLSDAQTDTKPVTLYPEQIEELTGLPANRLNIATLWLKENGLIEATTITYTEPYAFAFAYATYQTRRWLRSRVA